LGATFPKNVLVEVWWGGAVELTREKTLSIQWWSSLRAKKFSLGRGAVEKWQNEKDGEDEAEFEGEFDSQVSYNRIGCRFR
jgi:hypothetical protein